MAVHIASTPPHPIRCYLMRYAPPNPTAGDPHEKRCARCRRLRPRSEFPRNRSAKDGRHAYCRDCDRNRRRLARLRTAQHKRANELSRHLTTLRNAQHATDAVNQVFNGTDAPHVAHLLKHLWDEGTIPQRALVAEVAISLQLRGKQAEEITLEALTALRRIVED